MRILPSFVRRHGGLGRARRTGQRTSTAPTGVVSPSIQWVEEPLKSDTSRTPIPVPNEMVQLLVDAIQLDDGRVPASDSVG